MLENGSDYFKKRAQELGLDRMEVLEQIQVELDRLYPDQTKAMSLNDQVLKIITPSSAVASELRLNQIRLLNRFRQIDFRYPINRLNIQIRSL